MSTEPSLLTPPSAPQSLQLYPHQLAAIDGLRDEMRQGHKRVILCAPTGSGKTEMAIHLIQEAREKDSRVAFVADRITLVDQTSRRLSDYGIQHGVAQGNNTKGRRERLQVCSAQTIEKRDYWQSLDLLIIDECHVQRKTILEFAKGWNGPVVGLTATPLTDGLGEFYQGIVNACTTDFLLREIAPATGRPYLSPLRIYAATEIDMRGAKKTAGEWQASEVRTRSSRIIGDIVTEWVRMTQEHFGGPVKTLAFSADVAHGEQLCQAFQLAGYDFRQSTYRDGDEDTRRMVEAFRRGEFLGLVSVEKFVKGFDVPDVPCMIGARPYSSSLASVIQQLGRGMRTAPGKEYCLYLDHAGNMAGWYDEVCEIWENGVDHLPEPAAKKQTRKEGQQREDVVCKCGFVIPPGAANCPYCGSERKGKRPYAETVEGRMEAVDRPTKAEWAKDREWVWSQLSALALKRKEGDADAASRTAAGYYKGIYGRFPRWGKELDPCDVQDIDGRVVKMVQSNLIRYAKSKRQAA